jgi:hypothetical protein
MTSLDYVHGYTEEEATRLADQAQCRGWRHFCYTFFKAVAHKS